MSSAIHTFPKEYIDLKKEEFKSRYKENTLGCHIWTGALGGKRSYDGGSRYVVVKFTHPFTKKKTVLNSHVVSFFFHTGLLPSKPEGIEISHICNKSSCINPEHLSREPHVVNAERTRCVSRRLCLGHDSYPDCLFLTKPIE